jgi:hypothetical protein
MWVKIFSEAGRSVLVLPKEANINHDVLNISKFGDVLILNSIYSRRTLGEENSHVTMQNSEFYIVIPPNIQVDQGKYSASAVENFVVVRLSDKGPTSLIAFDILNSLKEEKLERFFLTYQDRIYCPRDMGNGIIKHYAVRGGPEHVFICDECETVWLKEQPLDEVSYYFADDFLKDRNIEFGDLIEMK